MFGTWQPTRARARRPRARPRQGTRARTAAWDRRAPDRPRRTAVDLRPSMEAVRSSRAFCHWLRKYASARGQRPGAWPRRWPPDAGAVADAMAARVPPRWPAPAPGRGKSRAPFLDEECFRSDDARPGPELREPSLARINSRPTGRVRAARGLLAPRSCLAEERRRLAAGPPARSPRDRAWQRNAGAWRAGPPAPSPRDRASQRNAGAWRPGRAGLAPRSRLAEECRRLPAGSRGPGPESCLAEERRDFAGACRPGRPHVRPEIVPRRGRPRLRRRLRAPVACPHRHRASQRSAGCLSEYPACPPSRTARGPGGGR